MWNAALISIYAVSLVQLQGMQGPLASLNMASKVTYRYSRYVGPGAWARSEGSTCALITASCHRGGIAVAQKSSDLPPRESMPLATPSAALSPSQGRVVVSQYSTASFSYDRHLPLRMRVHRIRAVALGLVTAGNAPTRSMWRDLLKGELVLFESDYRRWRLCVRGYRNTRCKVHSKGRRL